MVPAVEVQGPCFQDTMVNRDKTEHKTVIMEHYTQLHLHLFTASGLAGTVSLTVKGLF